MSDGLIAFCAQIALKYQFERVGKTCRAAYARTQTAISFQVERIQSFF
jgi:hypothetical protein